MSIDFHDSKTWDLIQSGKSKGLFQCESPLVQHWLKEIAPFNVWEVSDVIAGVRPGSLKSGAMNDYLDIKNGEKEIESLGDARIDKVLSTTKGVLLYQEQLMLLGKNVAWPHLEENEKLVKVDNLRKAVGKKNQKKILEIGQEFVAGCIHNGIHPDVANRLFEIIKNSGRYLFNASHSMSYAHWSYQTALLKANYPLQFFCVYLEYADEKLDKWQEIHDLVQDAKLHNIKVLTPNINSKNPDFMITECNNIRYGISHIKFVNKNFIEIISQLPEITNWKQVIILCCTKTYGINVNIKTSEALIKTGCFVDTGISRKDLLELIQLTNQLTDKEKDWVMERIHNCDTIVEYTDLLNKCVETVCNKRRRPTLESHIKMAEFGVQDPIGWIETSEKFYLGTFLTGTASDFMQSGTTDTIMDCIKEVRSFSRKEVGCIIKDVRITVTKKGDNPGQEMAIIDLYDSSGELNKVPVFPETYKTCSDLLLVDNLVIVSLLKGKKGWIIERIEQG